MKKMMALPVMLAALLPTLSSCSGIPEVDFKTFDNDIREAKKILYDTDPLNEYKFTINVNKQYFDSVVHRYQTMEFEIDLAAETPIVYFTDDTDDHNGSNHFVGKSKFWFWCNTVTGALGTAMIADGDCGQSVYNVIDGTYEKSMQSLKTKSQPTIDFLGTIGEPMSLSYETVKYMHDLYMQYDIKPDKFLDTNFITKSNGKDFYLEIYQGNVNGEEGHEYREIYEMKDYLITKHSYHSKNSVMSIDISVEFNYTEVDIVKPTRADIIEHENNREPKQ